MGCRMCGFNATTLVNCHINNHATFGHFLEHFACDELGCACTCNQDTTHNCICCADDFADIVGIAVECLEFAVHHIIEIAQAFNINIKQGHACAHAQSYLGGICANRATTQNHNMRRIHTGDTTHENTTSTCV